MRKRMKRDIESEEEEGEGKKSSQEESSVDEEADQSNDGNQNEIRADIKKENYDDRIYPKIERKNEVPDEKAAEDTLNSHKKVKTSTGETVKTHFIPQVNVGNNNTDKADDLGDKADDLGEDADENSDIQWRYLEHHGVLFPDYWIKHNINITYHGHPIKLTLFQEEMATCLAQTLGSAWEHKPTYRSNFSMQFLETFGESKSKYEFDKFDFSAIKIHLEKQLLLRNDRTKEEKNAEKKKQEEISNYYAGAILDNYREKVEQFMIEPPTLFKGKGEHPKMGLMKGRTQPEAVVINIAKDAPVPKCSVPGHAWNEIVHNNRSTWLASYKDYSVNTQHKFTFIAAESKSKAEKDKKSFEKARRLKNHISIIREDYERKLRSSLDSDRQLGTATYLIDKFAFRIGNEKHDEEEEEADTVGCCSLRVQHIQILDDNQISIDFLEYDFMRYQNTLKVTEIVCQNIQHFITNKKTKSYLFDKIDASSLNEYLKGMMEGLTAKVFRTFNVSDTLQKELDNSDAEKIENLDLKDKLRIYYEANRNVATLCNHQRAIENNFDVLVEKSDSTINILREYEKELNAYLAQCNENGTLNASEKEIILEEKEDGKHAMLVKKFPGTKDKIQAEIQKIKKKIEEKSSQNYSNAKNNQVPLGISKTNYKDPRISVNWCKKLEVPIEQIFSKTVIAKFAWAMETDLEWSF